MGNKPCIPKTRPTAHYVVPAVFISAQMGGKKKSSDNDGNREKEAVDAKEQEPDLDGEKEEEIDSELTDNILIEDDEMNRLFEEDLDADDAEIERESVDRETEKGADDTKPTGKGRHPVQDLDEETQGSSSSPYGHGKRPGESSHEVLPLYQDSDSHAH